MYFSQFGVDEPLIRDTLRAAMGRGGDHADLYFQHQVSSSLGLEDGEINRAHTEVMLGVGVRVVKGDQTGYAYTEELTAASLRSAAEAAAAIADGPARRVPAVLRIGALPSRYPMRRPWQGVGTKEKLPILRRANQAVLSRDSRIKKASVWLDDEENALLIADSTGRLVEDLRPMTVLCASCLAEHGSRREENAYNLAARSGFEIYTPDRVDRVARQAADSTLVLLEAGPAPLGEMPVVLAAGSSGILLHEAIGHGMEADLNRKNGSIYADKLGKPIARDFVNIVDDGTQAGARGALNVDDEGNVAGSVQLVENGILTGYLHDSMSAAHYGVEPTGNGRRESYKHAPMPRMRSTYMLPGPHHKDEIIGSVRKGIYCAAFTNGQVQIGAGDFTFYVKNGYLIEDGKLTRPIKDVNVIGNGPRVLENIDMVADDLVIDEGGWFCGKDGQTVPISHGMPTTRVATMTVGGNEG